MRLMVSLLMLLGAASPATARDTAAERLKNATVVFTEIMQAPDRIPDDLLGKAHCLVIVPGVKQVGFVVGGKYGRGFISCRGTDGAWGAPAALRIEGGSFGLQIGASETDLIMLLMDPRSKKGILSSKFTLGGAAEVAAGPVGRSGTAQTDATMNAKILSYSRSRGAFAGIALTGATLRQDLDENAEMYGKPLSTRDIVEGKVKQPDAAGEFLSTLSKYAPADRDR